MTTDTITPHDVLVRARELLTEEAWLTRRVCAFTVLWDAHSKLDPFRDNDREFATEKAFLAAAGLVPKGTEDMGYDASEQSRTREAVYCWNDAVGRTYEDVTNAYDKAIEASK